MLILTLSACGFYIDLLIDPLEEGLAYLQDLCVDCVLVQLHCFVCLFVSITQRVKNRFLINFVV